MQGLSRGARLTELFGGATCRGEAFNNTAMTFRALANDLKRRGLPSAGKTLEAVDTMGRSQHFLDSLALRWMEELADAGLHRCLLFVMIGATVFWPCCM